MPLFLVSAYGYFEFGQSVIARWVIPSRREAIGAFLEVSSAVGEALRLRLLLPRDSYNPKGMMWLSESKPFSSMTSTAAN
jgi:hypothetical protein